MTSRFSRRSSLARFALAGCIAVPLLAGCGGSTSSAASDPTSAPASPSVPESPTTAPTGDPGAPMYALTDCGKAAPPTGADTIDGGYTIDGITISGTAGQVPKIAVKKDLPPASQLVIKDLIPGTGAAVAAGATVTAQYCGIGQQTRSLFDSSWARGGAPVQFPLNGVIQGWADGLPGMKVGGRRLLIIPGALAYGPNPPSAEILPNETLIFVVDLVSTP